MRTCRSDAKGAVTSGSIREGRSTDAEHGGGAARSRDDGPVMGLDRRGCVVQLSPEANWQQEEPRDEARPLDVCAGGLNIGSRVKREFHARFWERLGVRFPRATRQLQAINIL